MSEKRRCGRRCRDPGSSRPRVCVRRCGRRSQSARPVLGAEIPPRPAGVLPSWRCVFTSFRSTVTFIIDRRSKRSPRWLIENPNEQTRRVSEGLELERNIRGGKLFHFLNQTHNNTNNTFLCGFFYSTMVLSTKGR